MPMGKIEFLLYSRKQCSLCNKAKMILEELSLEIGSSYIEIDIDTSDELTEKYGLMIPVLELNGDIIQYGKITKQALYLKNLLNS
jgi:glutaredoxin